MKQKSRGIHFHSIIRDDVRNNKLSVMVLLKLGFQLIHSTVPDTYTLSYIYALITGLVNANSVTSRFNPDLISVYKNAVMYWRYTLLSGSAKTLKFETPVVHLALSVYIRLSCTHVSFTKLPAKKSFVQKSPVQPLKMDEQAKGNQSNATFE